MIVKLGFTSFLSKSRRGKRMNQNKMLKTLLNVIIIAVSVTSAQDFTFTVTVQTDNPADGSYDLEFGFSPEATDGYDEGIDQYAPPPLPPPSFDAAIGWGADRYYTQILEGDNDLTLHVYNIQLQFGLTNIVNFSWDITNWSALMDSAYLSFPFSSLPNINLMENTTLTFTNPSNNWFCLNVIPKNTLAIDEQVIPNAYGLSDAYPNPFNPETTIKYSLNQSGMTTLEIFDLLGRPVTTLVNEYQSASDYTITWGGTDMNHQPVSSGVYFYKLTSGEYSDMKKVMLMK